MTISGQLRSSPVKRDSGKELAITEQPDILTVAGQIFAAQPFTRLLGAELVTATLDAVTIRLELRDDLLQQHGYAHGGVISYLADNAITFAGGIAFGGDALTSEFKINYLRPAKGGALIATAGARSVGGKQAVCQCEIAVEGRETELVAIALGTIVKRG